MAADELRADGEASLSRTALEAALPAGASLLLDTSALIAYLSTPESTTPAIRMIVDEFVGRGRNVALVSAVSATELLIRPIRAAARTAERHVVEFLREFSNLELVPVDLAVAREAARLRAVHGLLTADALVVASGTVRDAGVFVTADAAWSRLLADHRPPLRICQLRSFAAHDERSR